MTGREPTSPCLSASKRRRTTVPKLTPRASSGVGASAATDVASALTAPPRRRRCRAMPATLVGTPAVIACTTSCCVVARRSKTATLRPEAQARDPIRDLEDVVQVVGDDDDREALGSEPGDEVEHLAGLRDAERGGRLVEDDEARVPHAPRVRSRPTAAGRPRGSRPAAAWSGSSSRRATSSSPPSSPPSPAPSAAG